MTAIHTGRGYRTTLPRTTPRQSGLGPVSYPDSRYPCHNLGVLESVLWLTQVLIPWYLELLEKNIRLQSPSRIEELVKIFIHATKVCFRKIFFWGIEGCLTVTDGNWVLGNVPV